MDTDKQTEAARALTQAQEAFAHMASEVIDELQPNRHGEYVIGVHAYHDLRMALIEWRAAGDAFLRSLVGGA